MNNDKQILQEKKDSMMRTLIRWQNGKVDLSTDAAEELWFRCRALSRVIRAYDAEAK